MTDDIEKKLEALRDKAKDIGRLYGAKETADDYLKTTYAELYADVPDGTVGEKDAWIRRQPRYLKAVERKQNAYADWKTADTYTRILLAEVDVWRTKEASNRNLDRAHR